MNLYDKLLRLQELEHAFEEWEPYRNQLTQYIIQQIPAGESLAIFGAGRCNDMDLKRLTTHFGKVVLLDKDEWAMKEAMSRYGLEESPVLQTKVVDFVGNSGAAYRRYADALVNEVRKLGTETNCHDLVRVAMRQLDAIEEDIRGRKTDLGKGTYENVVVVGIHSQLISMLEWIWSIMLQTIGKNEDSVRNRITQMNDTWIQKFNQDLVDVTTQYMILGCEEERIGRIGGVQGAVQGMKDIKDRQTKGQLNILDTTRMDWPFNTKQNVTYRMQIQKILMV